MVITNSFKQSEREADFLYGWAVNLIRETGLGWNAP
jgi:hypothetical protein